MRFVFAVMFSLWAALAAHAQPASYYPCTLMVLDSTDLTSSHQVISFTSAALAQTFFGSSGVTEACMAESFFAPPPSGYGFTAACSGGQTIKYLRFPVTAARAHWIGGNLASTLSGLRSSFRSD